MAQRLVSMFATRQGYGVRRGILCQEPFYYLLITSYLLGNKGGQKG